MIKAIIFDLGNVILTNGTSLALKKFEQDLRIDINKLKQVFKEGIGKDYRLNRISEGEFWERAQTQLGFKVSTSKLKEQWFSAYVPIKGIFELLTALKKGYKLAILSDNIKERVTFLNDRYNINSYFDISIYSCDIGIAKPNLKFYQEAVKRLKVNPEECLYIDDKEKNLVPAKELGMNSLLFESLEKLKKDFQRLGISFS